MNIKKMTLGMFQSNCYIIIENQHAVLVDPGDDGKKIVKFLSEHELQVEGILLTHGHIDHIGAVNYLTNAYPEVKVYIHKEDESFLTNPRFNISSNYLNTPYAITYPVTTLQDGEVIEFSDMSFKCFHLPGHTPGSCMYELVGGNILFSGDVLFQGSIGRYDLPQGSHHDTKESIEKIKLLDPGFIVLPGHGGQTTIKDEIETNPFF